MEKAIARGDHAIRPFIRPAHAYELPPTRQHRTPCLHLIHRPLQTRCHGCHRKLLPRDTGHFQEHLILRSKLFQLPFNELSQALRHPGRRRLYPT